MSAQSISSDVVGTEVGPVAQTIDARWLMAYAAALGETDPRYYDTGATGGVIAHPLFPVCYEWPVVLAIRDRAGLAVHYPRLVHAQHDLALHRAPRAGDLLQSTARVIAASQRAPGAFLVTRCETRAAGGELVTVSDFGSLYRGVALDGGDRQIAEGSFAIPETAAALDSIGKIAIPATLGHVYSECARIWNPIHTDLAYARAAGLPGIILHGTATLALSVSRALAAFGTDPAQVRRVRCRFSGMVPMPAMLEVRAGRQGGEIDFEAHCSGTPVISRGSVMLAAPAALG
jgi:acyl dehydratase